MAEVTNMLNQYEEEMMYELGAQLGDPRTCRRHPHVRTSSNDGMHDAPCGLCEMAMEEDGEW